MVWGLLFGGIPLVAIIASGQFYAWLLLFIIIGLCAFIYGFVSMIKAIRDNGILKHGKDGVGNFITAIGCGAVNDVPMFKIEFEYVNENGETKHATTHEQYTYDEVELFKALDKFDIKYTNSNAVINPNQKFSNVTKQPSTKVEPNKAVEQKQEEKHTCNYCDTEYIGDKCPNCGASKFK